MIFRAVADSVPGERRSHLLLHPGVEHRPRPFLDAPAELFHRDIETDHQRRVTRLVLPQPVAGERVAGLGELERAHDPAAVVRVHGRGGSGVALGEERVGSLGTLVVEALPPLARAGLGRRRHVQAAQGSAEVQTGAADDHGCSPGRERSVDRRMGELLVLGDRCLVVELPDRDERRRRLVGQDRQAAVELCRVGRDELGRDLARDRLGDGALAARRRPEEPEDGQAQAAAATSWAPLSVVEVAPPISTGHELARRPPSR